MSDVAADMWQVPEKRFFWPTYLPTLSSKAKITVLRVSLTSRSCIDFFRTGIYGGSLITPDSISQSSWIKRQPMRSIGFQLGIEETHFTWAWDSIVLVLGTVSCPCIRPRNSWLLEQLVFEERYITLQYITLQRKSNSSIDTIVTLCGFKSLMSDKGRSSACALSISCRLPATIFSFS
jgi:hypothetical protein